MSLGTNAQSSLLARQRWLVIGLVGLFVVVGVQYGRKVTVNSGRSAILRWNDPLLGLWEGDNIYERYQYPNPPIMAILLSPFANLSTFSALLEALSWFYLKAGLLLLSLHWVFLMVQENGRPFPPWAKEGVVLLSIWPLMGDLTHGNINLFILFLVIAGLYAFYRDWPVLCGLLLALAVSCKVTPALFVPYFVWKRSWKTLLGIGVGLVLFLWLAPGIWLGQERNAELFLSWWRQMVEPYIGGGIVYSGYENQSLPGLIVRLFTHSPSFSNFDFIENIYVPLRYDNVVSLDHRITGWIIKGCMGAFSLAVVWLCRTPTTPPRDWRLAAEFAIVILGMLLFSERTWKHHCVTLVLPFAVLLYALVNVDLTPALHCYLIGTLLASALLMASASISLLDSFYGISKWAHVYGVYVWTYALLLVSLLVLLGKQASLSPGADNL
ncbi:MAG: glycosyltransferase family 87 protein [Gemmataceae bacterium]